ncbi:hypothetical protein ACIRBX_00405 [Kitasatospora sp. NPDC096147]|uniref:hypothetical protein n=1 Tax=Kitasatospora sp. NPDC096147 TaxID=3364093 RepID=UPI0038244A35
MHPDMTPDQMLRAVNALEAAWKQDDRALTTLARTGPGEPMLARLVARYCAQALELLLSERLGLADRPPAEREGALATLEEGVSSRLLIQWGYLLESWARATPDTPAGNGGLARAALQSLTAFTHNGDPGNDVPALLAHLRANATTLG